MAALGLRCKARKSRERALTHRGERHFYVLTASGSVGAGELTRVGDCGSRRPAGTLSSIGLEGVSAAAGTQVCFSVSCNDISSSLLLWVADSLI